MSWKKRVDVGGGEALGQNPFAALDKSGLPDAPGSAGKPESAQEAPRRAAAARGRRGRIEIRREKSGRGGKVVTTATAFQGVCPAEQREWVSQLRKQCGAGGTSRPGAIEIQGDRRDEMMRFFEERGFRPVLAGG